MSRSLGSLGVVHEDPGDVVTFDYFGEQIRVHPDINDGDITDWVEQAQEIKEGDARAALLIKDLLRSCVHPDDFDRCWALSKANRQNNDDRMAVVGEILKTLTGFPTGESSDSSDGQPSTDMRSTDGSFSAAIAQLRDRPDLQLLVYQAQEHRQTG